MVHSISLRKETTEVKMKKVFSGLLFSMMIAIFFTGCNKEPSPNDFLQDYVNDWEEQRFEKMYKEYLSTSTKKEVTREAFVNRYEKIYGDMEVENIKISFSPIEEKGVKKQSSIEIPLDISFHTFAGEVKYEEKLMLVKEKDKDEGKRWFVQWQPNLILPGLTHDDKVRISSIEGKRGEIFDRHQKPLATNGTAYEIGLVPEQIEENGKETKEKLAKVLQIPVEEINKKLHANWVKPNLFVPIKKVASIDQKEIEEILALKGVYTQEIERRVYPYGKVAAHLTGYIGAITAEELQKKEEIGYEQNSLVGKRGLEQVFEDKLRGERGGKIAIDKGDGKVETIVEKKPKDGENIQLTIDITLQASIFAEMKGNAGTSVAMNPQNGEVLSLVSTPAFDPNDFVLGISTANYKKLEEDDLHPLINRFALTYTPGSAIKPITAAIALTSNSLKLTDKKQIQGKSWQKDSSWGDYSITRVTPMNTPIHLEKAMIYSDNIFFAQTALDVGEKTFIAGLQTFGFEETIPFAFPLKKSSISKEGTLKSDILLADTGYGQGQMQMNILHLATAYTPFINNGDMIKPILLTSEKKGQTWHKDVLNENEAKAISHMLRKVVTDPKGTGHDADIEKIAIAGKTGTSELKKKKAERGKENGIFVGYDAENTDLLIAMLIEGVEEKGGSTFVVKKTANVLKKNHSK